MPSNQLPDDLHREDSNPSHEPNLSKNAAIGIGFAWDLGYIIAVPAVVLGFGGAWVDKSLHTKPLFMLVGIAIASVLSGIQVFRKIRTIIDSFPEDLPKKPVIEEHHRVAGEDLHDALRPKTAKKGYLDELIEKPVVRKSDDLDP